MRPMGGVEDWFLTADERGQPATELDRRHDRRRGVDQGNAGDGAGRRRGGTSPEVVRGACRSGAGDWCQVTDWRGDGDELLGGPGTEIGTVLADARARAACTSAGCCGARTRRSALRRGARTSQFSRAVNEAGGEVLLDQRVRRGGSHHQKLVVVRTARATGRRTSRSSAASTCATVATTTPRHHGDPQAIELDDALRRAPAVARHAAGGARPRRRRPRVHVPRAVGGPTPARSPQPACRARVAPVAASQRIRTPLPPSADRPGAARPARGAGAAHLPAQRRAVPVRARRASAASPARTSRRSRRARRSIYLEDQYLWSLAATEALADALAREPELRCRGRDPALPRSATGASPVAPSRIGASSVLERPDARRRRPGRGLRPRERRGHADLRARQGVHRRRRVDGGGLRQPQPAFVDPRLGAVVRRARRRPRRARAARSRPASATVRACSRARRGCGCGASTSGADPDDVGDLVDPERGFDALLASAPRSTPGTTAVGSVLDRQVMCASTNPTASRSGTNGGRTRVGVVVNDPDGRSLRHRRTDHY